MPTDTSNILGTSIQTLAPDDLALVTGGTGTLVVEDCIPDQQPGAAVPTYKED